MERIRRTLAGLISLALTGLAPMAAPAGATTNEDPLPRVPPGFVVSPYAAVSGTPASLAFGRDTRTGRTGSRLYVADAQLGQVFAIDPVASTPDGSPVAGGQPQVFEDGFSQPLGVVAADDGTVFVSDSEGPRSGPFGTRTYGRVWRLRDTNGDGTADQRQLVLKDLPNGRHNTNGLAFGPDGMLYVANGNSTDDGVAGGDAEIDPWSGAVVRISPAASDVSAASLGEQEALVAEGMRNLFDVEFSPFDPTRLLIPTNGSDTPESDDLLYLTDIDDERQKRDPITGELLFDEDGNPIMEQVIDDFGFPSCLYRGSLTPFQNPQANVISRFGPCKPEDIVRPVETFGLHVSADGLAFQRTSAWGPAYRNDLFVAEFGNFFGNRVVGHRVVHVDLAADGKSVVRTSDFLSGAFPLDVTFSADGAMFVADFGGAIYRVSRAAEVPGVVEVQMGAFQFVPAALTIPEGTVVRWRNTDVAALPHNVTGQASVRSDGTQGTASELNSANLNPGETHEVRFDTPGQWAYTCTFNPIHTAAMHGSITVVPAGS